MQAMWGDGRLRRVLSGRAVLGGASMLAIVSGVAGLAVLGAAGVAMGQAPRYQSPGIDAPVPRYSLPLPAPRSSPDAVVVEDVIARVNDQIIDRSDMERSEQQLAEEAQQEHMSAADVATRQKNMLREMIDQQLLLSRGKELDINVDADVVRQLDAIRKQHNIDSMEALEKAVRESGITYEDFKANIKNGIIQQMVVRDEVSRTLRRPTAKEEQVYYDQHKQDFAQPEQVKLSEILIPAPADASDAQIAQAQAKAAEVETKLKAGAKFDEMAKQFSGGPTADKGGDLGQPYKRGMLPGLEEKVFPLKTGEFTAPIRTRQGFVILKVTDHQEGGVPALKDVSDQIDDAMFTEMMQPALRKYMTDLRNKASIDIAAGFVDTGASPNEIKLVQSAATPPPVKKSVVKKQRLTPAAPPAAAPSTAKAASASGADAAPGTTGSGSGAAGAARVNVSSHKKTKKIKREKIRFGQAPRNSLPAGPTETLASGSDQGVGATSSDLPATGMIASGAFPIGAPSNVASNTDLLAPQVPDRGKTRYSDRAAGEAAAKAEAKAAKLQQKAAVASPTPINAEEKSKAQAQDAALGLNGDTTKKKKKKDKDAPKERLQNQAPAPAAAPTPQTPLPPKSVRDNGEPLAAPAPDLSGVAPAPPAAPAPAAPATAPQP
jgi:peptidyl-prolyl cis-trans isomerase SurA